MVFVTDYEHPIVATHGLHLRLKPLNRGPGSADVPPKVSDVSVPSCHLPHESTRDPVEVIGPLAHDLSARSNHDHPVDLSLVDQHLGDGAGGEGLPRARSRIDEEVLVLAILEKPASCPLQSLSLPRSELQFH